MKKIGLVKKTLVMGLMLMVSATAAWADQHPAEAWTEITVDRNTALTSGYYYITTDCTLENKVDGNGIQIAGGAEVHIYIPAGLTLTAIGAAGSGTTPGKAGILLLEGAKLCLHGGGTVIATGGAAGNGAKGGNGQQGHTRDELGGQNPRGGAGGAGGAGGGGAGAGIGTNGATGGAGGAGGVESADENAGKSGTQGSSVTASIGTLCKEATITLLCQGGAGGNGGAGGQKAADKGDYQTRQYAGGGCGGAGGGGGQHGKAIGSGGGGGGGGGGGTSGPCGNSPWSCEGGKGGKGYINGSDGANNTNGSGRTKSGGAGGAVGSYPTNYISYDNGETTAAEQYFDAKSNQVISPDNTEKPIQFNITLKGSGYNSGASRAALYYVGTSGVTYQFTAGDEDPQSTLPSLGTGLHWELSTWGRYFGSGTDTPTVATEPLTSAFDEETFGLNYVYGNLVFTACGNTHTLTASATTKDCNDNDITVSGNSMSLQKSVDGGVTWTDISSGDDVQYMDKLKLVVSIADGYYVDYSAGSATINDADKTFNMPDADEVVTVTFREINYTVKYNMNGGSGSIDDQTKYHLTDLTLSSTLPIREGYDFLGWSLDADAIIATWTAGASVGSALNGSTAGATVNVYAVWRAINYTVTIDPSICGGTVTSASTAHAGDNVLLTIKMDEGYTRLNELYYTVEGSSTQNSIDQGTLTFTMPANHVTVFASFRGAYSLSLDGTVSDGKLLIGKTELGTAEVGRKVKLTVKAAADKRLKSIAYQKVAGTNVMRTRAASDVPIYGKTTIMAADPSVEYFSQQGVYVATIDNVDSDLRVTAEFEEKLNLSDLTVALQGVSPTYPAGSAPDDSGWYATVGGAAQETDVDVSLTHAMSPADYNEGSVGSITVTALPNNKTYKGSVDFANQFTMVKVADANYTIDDIPSYVYTGAAITPVPVVRDGETVLTVSTDYEAATYANNMNVGTATVQVKINGDAGYVTKTFLITPKDLIIKAGTKDITYGDNLTSSTSDVTVQSPTSLATGDAITGITLSSPSNLTGSHELIPSGAIITNGDSYRTGNYSFVYQTGTLTISPRAATVTAANKTITYGDEAPTQETLNVTATGLQYNDQLSQKPTLGTTYTKGSNIGTYPISCGNNPTVAAGSTEVTSCYTFTGNNGELTVQAFDLANAVITVSDNTKGYNGTTQIATVVVKTPDNFDITGDCYIYYGAVADAQTSKTERGTYAITAVPKTTNVTGQKEAEETLNIGLKSITDQTGSNYDVTMTGASKTYTGSRIEPALSDITVTYLGNNLTDDQKTAELEIAGYSDNLIVGTGHVSVMGKNMNFSGIRDDVPFTIIAADLSTRLNTTNTQYATTVRAEDVGGGNVRTVTPSANIIMMPYQGVPFQLKAEDVEVWLTGGSNKLPVADYALKYKKGGVTYDNIDDIGTFTVVIVAGTSGNTTDAYETALTVETQREIVLTKNEWVTYYDGTYDLQKPEGYEVYYVTAVNNVTREVSATSLDYIPKDVPLLLHRLATTYGTDFSDDAFTVAVTAWTGATVSPSDISYDFWGIGSTEAAHAKTTYGTEDNFTDYIIVKSLFVKAEPNTTVEMHRCFLRVANNTSSPARSYYSIAVDDDATGISGNASDGLGAEKWYDLQGNRINKPTRKGVYIKNGTKVVIK